MMKKSDFYRKFIFALFVAPPLAVMLLSGCFTVLYTSETGEILPSQIVLSLLTLLLFALNGFLAWKIRKKGVLRFFLVFWSIAAGCYFLLYLLNLSSLSLPTLPVLILNLPIFSYAALIEPFSVTQAAGKLILNLLPALALITEAGILLRISPKKPLEKGWFRSKLAKLKRKK